MSTASTLVVAWAPQVLRAAELVAEARSVASAAVAADTDAPWAAEPKLEAVASSEDSNAAPLLAALAAAAAPVVAAALVAEAAPWAASRVWAWAPREASTVPASGPLVASMALESPRQVVLER